MSGKKPWNSPVSPRYSIAYTMNKKEILIWKTVNTDLIKLKYNLLNIRNEI